MLQFNAPIRFTLLELEIQTDFHILLRTCWKTNNAENLAKMRRLLKEKQDGNVPSRRHILGSKIFKEQLLEKFGKKNFFQKKILIFFRKKVFLGRTMPKNSLKNLWFSAGFEPTLSGWVEDER